MMAAIIAPVQFDCLKTKPEGTPKQIVSTVQHIRDIFTPRELMTLASIVQVGDATYRELMETQRPMFGHPYFDDTRGRIRTKVVQMQCEIESHDPKFPFEFVQGSSYVYNN